MKKVYATLRALIDVMEALSKEASIEDRVGRLIIEEVNTVFPGKKLCENSYILTIVL